MILLLLLPSEKTLCQNIPPPAFFYNLNLGLVINIRLCIYKFMPALAISKVHLDFPNRFTDNLISFSDKIDFSLLFQYFK